MFSTLQLLSHRRKVANLSLFYHYFHSRCSLVPPVQTVTASSCHVPYKTNFDENESTHTHSLHIPLVSFTQPASYPELLHCGTNSSLITTILITLKYATLARSLYALTTSSFSKPLSSVVLKLCIG